MARLVLGAAGAIIGNIIAPGVGGYIGWALGSALGGAFEGSKKRVIDSGPSTDTRVVGTEYGQVIPYLRGTARLAPQIWYASVIRPIAVHSTQEGGGKGGGGESVDQVSYVYEVDLLLGFTSNECAAMLKMFFDGGLVLNISNDGEGETLESSLNSEKWADLRPYTGEDDQLPDVDYEAAVGTAMADAYLGRFTVFIKSLQLGGSTRIPNITGVIARTVESTAGTGDVEFDWNNDTGVRPHRNSAHLSTVKPTGSYFVTFPISDTQVYLYEVDAATDVLTNIATLNRSGDGEYIGQGDKECLASATTGVPTQITIRWIDDPEENPTTLTTVNYTVLAAVGYFNREAFHVEGDDLFLVTLVASSGTNTVRRYSRTGGGAALAVSPELGAEIYSTGSCIALGQNVIYVLTTANIKKLDRDTLAVLETIPIPSGSSAGGAVLYDYPHDTELFYLQYDGGSLENLYRWEGGSSWSLFAQLEHAGFEHQDAGGASLFRLSYGVLYHTKYIDVGGGSYTRSLYECEVFTGQSTGLNEDVIDTYEAVLLRAGYEPDEIDVSALVDITSPLRGLPVAQANSTRAICDLLNSFFHIVLIGVHQLIATPRGGAAVVTIPFEDLGVVLGRGKPDGLLPLTWGDDLMLPAQKVLSYPNVDRDYNTDTVRTDRLLSSIEDSQDSLSVPLVMTAEEAQGRVDTLQRDQVVASKSTKFALGAKYSYLNPGDVVNLTARDGSVHRMRLVQREDQFPRLVFEAVRDDPGILSHSGIANVDYSPSTEVTAAVDSLIVLLDIPVLRDADDETGHYVKAKGDGTPYAGTVLFKSADDVTMTKVATITESGVFGDCETTLGDWVGKPVIDWTNVVRVNVGAGVTLTSTTYAAVIADKAENAYAIGEDGRWELGQFIIATFVSDGVYDLSGLLRGQNGTEWAMVGHEAGEIFVLLEMTGMRRVLMENSEVGLDRYYRGVTIGRLLTSADSEQFSNDAEGKKPWAPVGLKCVRDPVSGDATLTCRIRSRLACRLYGTLGTSIPDSEDIDTVEWDIYTGSPLTYRRTLESEGDTVTYTAAEQIADGLALGVPLSFYAEVFKMSDVVGRGHALTGVV